MFKRNNKQIAKQSSQSDLQSDNQVTQNQERKIMYDNEHQDDSQSDDQNQEYDQEEDGQQLIYSNKRNNLKNGGRKQNQDSDDEEEDSIQLIKDQIKHEYSRKQHDQQQQQDSLQEDSFDGAGQTYFKTIQAKNGIHTIREDPKQSLEDDSIDHIELRIKKLQKDLENRLNKHKNTNIQKQIIKIEDKIKNQGKIVGANKLASHPPIPVPQKKLSQQQDSQNKINTMNQPGNSNMTQKQKEKKIDVKKNYQNQYHIQTNIHAPPISMKEKKPIKKQQNPQNRPQRKSDKNGKLSNNGAQKKQKTKPKQQVSKGSKQKQQNKNQFFNDKPSHTDINLQMNPNPNHFQLNSKVLELQKVVKQLKLQNQVLRQKLQLQRKQGQKQREKQKQRSKHKTLQELQKIKDGSTNTKLQKQIQLLQVIEKLQVKLKKSIGRKLAKQNNSAASLMHKGVTSSIQSNN